MRMATQKEKKKKEKEKGEQETVACKLVLVSVKCVALPGLIGLIDFGICKSCTGSEERLWVLHKAFPETCPGRGGAGDELPALHKARCWKWQRQFWLRLSLYFAQ